jgi:hypothetical protein
VTASAAPADAERWRDVLLRDGTVSYRVRAPRRDECWRSAVATVLQVPIDDVPDWRLDERHRGGEDTGEIRRSAWQEMARWLAGRGQRMVTHRTVPAARARWIGVVPMRGLFNDHCLAMSWGEVLHDPTVDFQPVGLAKIVSTSQLATIRSIRPCIWGPEDVRYGFSFQKLRS